MNDSDFKTLKEDVQKTMKTLETIRKKKCIAVIGVDCATDLLERFLGVSVVISTTMFSGENIYIMAADESGH